jgi:8-oxo-dGTP pyrophosphatase MutT (NUDIX family)
MPFEHSAGAVVFRKEGGKPVFLLLHYQFKSEYWDFPRGKIEAGENAAQAALRETCEETGLHAVPVPGFKEAIAWFYRREGRNIRKDVIYFLAEAPRRKVRINAREHLGFAWLPYDEALARATHENTKNVLQRAHAFLARGLHA